MLKSLKLTSVGPSDELTINFAPRLTMLTGDNGLGKTFLMDVAWWSGARDWPNYPALPTFNNSSKKAQEPSIVSVLTGRGGAEITQKYNYDSKHNDWVRKGKSRPTIPGLLLYVRVDGGFSVWDPEQHYYKNAPSRGIIEPDRAPAFHFSNAQAWTGLADDNGTVICRGLIEDLITWQQTRSKNFDAFCEVLKHLSPDGEEIRIKDQPRRMPGWGAIDIPVLSTPSGNVPLPLASAGVKRIVTLAYLLIWTFSEHKLAVENRINNPYENRIWILIDELESHLHPKWQREILPALISVANVLKDDKLDFQFIINSHSPLVLASAEEFFEPEKDSIWNFRIENEQVVLAELEWDKYGEIDNWLTSNVFGLKEARGSKRAENIIQKAYAFMETPTAEVEAEQIEQELKEVLPTLDEFWNHWRMFRNIGKRKDI